ncbi:MAG: M15 family metallopeptidase [Candidatus Omnitrophica bacterium]|nr:M15 family metallopeptidase [Candidatus Omnitrophota bacterium]
MKRAIFFFPAFFFLVLSFSAQAAEGDWNLLSEGEKELLSGVLQKWEIWVPARQKDGTAPLMTYEELYQGLNEDEVRFLDRVRAIDPRKSFDFQGEYLGAPEPGIPFVKIEGQTMQKNGETVILDPQYLTADVYEAYLRMNEAMRKDLGVGLLIESGYRSHAYQLYTFLFYTPKHGYALAETGQWVAIPGYSEHGAPRRQALDFINEKGINGEDRVEDFEELPEYAWLVKNAARFGFELSYPRSQKGITFEPWHWRYNPSSETVQKAA